MGGQTWPACSSPEQSVPSRQTRIQWERTARRTRDAPLPARRTRPLRPASYRWHAESGYADHCAVLGRTRKTHRTMQTFVGRSWFGCLNRTRNLPSAAKSVLRQAESAVIRYHLLQLLQVRDGSSDENWHFNRRWRLSWPERSDPGDRAQGRSSLRRRVCRFYGRLARRRGEQDDGVGLRSHFRHTAARRYHPAHFTHQPIQARGRLAALHGDPEAEQPRRLDRHWR